jgi:hypothetical protein
MDTYNLFKDLLNGSYNGEKMLSWEELQEKNPEQVLAWLKIEEESSLKKSMTLGELRKIEISAGKIRLINETL